MAKNHCLDNKLILIPTEIGNDGAEVVIFDDEIVREGSKKWEFTVCGYFVGYKMSYQELKYNLFRMWGKYGLREIIPNGNGVFLFKFRNEEGINHIITNGPWMIMDQVTSNMCIVGTGRVGFVRVLVEVEAEKGLPGTIKIEYMNCKKVVTGKKYVKVEYDWAPALCSFCKVFGHNDKKCSTMPKTNEELEELKKAKAQKSEGNDEFVQVQRKKHINFPKVKPRNEENKLGTKNPMMFKPVVRGKAPNKGNREEEIKRNDDGRNNMNEPGSPKTMKEPVSPITSPGWNVNKNIIKSIRKSANKYSVLTDLTKEGGNLGNQDPAVLEEVDLEEVDVYEEVYGSASKIDLGKLAKQNTVKNLKTEEKLSVCDVLETRLKGQSVNIIGAKVFKGISYKTQDMKEFQDCVNSVKMADLSNTGLHYTWTKSLMNHNASVLKKINSVMGSGDFMEVYSRAHAVFLPYGISDHSPAILTCSNDVRKNTKSYRFANYIPDKMEFGNLVKALKKKLDEVQLMIDEDPHNRALRKMGVDALKEYSVALDDEEKLLFQKAKVNWLNDGDRNSAFFHKVVKGRINRSIMGEI
nr:hypothetical protein [Tanacetum cinerariifolium]